MPALRRKPIAGLDRLAAAAASAPTLHASRTLALRWLERRIPHDAALFHALSPRVPLATAAVHGLPLARLAEAQRGWDDLAVELGALRERANATLAASLDEVFPEGSRAGKRARARLWSMLQMRSLCIAHLIVRDRVRAGVILLAKRRRAFDARDLQLLRAVAPLLAVCDALHEQLDDAPRVAPPVHLRCRDSRLTERQRELVDLVALGHSNADIAAALGISPNTVRNTLARVFARVGAGNRAELIRLVVLSPG